MATEIFYEDYYTNCKLTKKHSTAIEQLNADSAQDDAIYNLQGMRVTNPTRGIYIKGGKKVVIR